ncbi:purple acid phosphatase family protein [Cohnella thailandensis]|uniref:Metallophosphoesterase family protein n=1 Tax=Cohnella thailandensis TaxID=557557 RepID=A0A841STC9_9BACL|nr:metallophosphoesterase family protein [Cohnella thailandensis]MBB6635194.1 metallophosphoesterase family protein [Cohnella thailandensis]MBP1974340.1 putative phosphodiesterase [Cohnella thailandensis]
MNLLRNYGLIALIISLLIAIGIGILIYQQRSARTEAPAAWTPLSLVTTFKSDPHTSRAFAWRTETPDAGTVLQVVPAEAGGSPSFEGADMLEFAGSTSPVDTGDTGVQGAHKAEATGLAAGTRYAYRVGDGDREHWSDVFYFATEKEETADFTFLNVTDSQGLAYADFRLWGRTLDKAFETFPDASFLVHNGDLTEDPENESGWEAFFGEARKWVAAYPLMPVTGNHDEVDKKAERFVSHFNVPNNGSPSSIEGTTYAFDYGLARFVVLNTESKLKDQAAWLEKELASTKQKWIIVALHRGPYAGNQDESVLERWVPLFDEYGVDLVLQGHNHEYSRSYPIKDGKVVSPGEGTVYVVTNASGAKFNEKKKDQFYHQVHFQNDKQTFAGIRVNERTLTYQAYDVDGMLLDEFTLEARR